MLPYSLRARRDYLLFRSRRYWPFYLSVFGLTVGVASALVVLVPGTVPALAVAGLTIAGYLVGAVHFGREWREHRERAGRLVLTDVHDRGIPAAPPQACTEAITVDHPVLGRAVVEDQVAAELDDPERTVRWRPDEFELCDELRGTAVQVIGERLRRREVAYNGPVVRLMADLCEPLPPSVPFQPVSFFDGECSNELTRWQIRDRGGRMPVQDFAARYVLDPDQRLQPLSTSLLANLVGVSTVAFTSDRKLIVLGQSMRSSASAGLLAPSGSGSLEPRDLPDGDEPRFRDFVIRGMERELCEECRFDSTVELETHLIGTARWVARGGKPELIGATVIPGMSADDVTGRRLRRSERVFHTQITTWDVDLDALADIDPATALDALPGVDRQLLGSASMPLLLGLRALGLRLGRGWRLPAPG